MKTLSPATWGVWGFQTHPLIPLGIGSLAFLIGEPDQKLLDCNVVGAGLLLHRAAHKVRCRLVRSPCLQHGARTKETASHEAVHKVQQPIIWQMT